MLSSPPNGALCTKYRALIAEMQKRKRPILCYSEFRAKALVRQTITKGYSLSDECLRTKLRVTENRSLPFLHFCYIYIYIYIYIYSHREVSTGKESSFPNSDILYFIKCYAKKKISVS